MSTFPPDVQDPEMDMPEEPVDPMVNPEMAPPLGLDPEMGIPSQPPTEPPVKQFGIGESVELTDEEKTALKYIRDTITRPDDEIRERMTPVWQMYENYWRGLQDVIYDSVSQSFLSASGVLKSAGELEDTYIGSKIVNVYRAHGESIAAAVSAGTPTITFFPEDADQPSDITTAKTYTVASEFVADDNDSKLLHLRALYTRWNQPFVAYYNTYVYDEEYGTIEKNRYGIQEVDIPEAFCPSCGEDLPVQTPNSMCPDCNVEAETTVVTNLIPKIEEVVQIPKGREVIEVYGPRHVRVPYNVKDLKQCGYLILETEHHWAALVTLYPQLAEVITSGSSAQSSTADQARRKRIAIEGSEPDMDQRTLDRAWFRTWTFNLVKDEEVRASLKVKFPHGVQCTFVDEEYVEAYDESMDDHWTLLPDPYAEHIHGDPLGKPEIPIQDMTNDTVQLTLETILFGIVETFADPGVLNFDKYKDAVKAPGNTFPAKRPAGMNLDAGFHQPRPATLSDNVEVFRQALDSMGQFVTGDSPGIFGGPLAKGSSRTADEYRQAKQGALQRLSIVWFALNVAWAQVMKKAVNELRIHMRFQGEDIKFVKEAGKGFTNVWIKLADIDDGRIGRVRAEASEQFPLTSEQQRGVLMELIQTARPELTQFIFAPENIGEFTRILIGLNRFKIPGEEDREYQLSEIQEMMSGMPAEIDPMIDNHQAHAMVIQSWAASEDGRTAKKINPMGYQLVMEHMQQHVFILQQAMAQAAAQEAAQAAASAPPPKGGQAQKTGAAEPPPTMQG